MSDPLITVAFYALAGVLALFWWELKHHDPGIKTDLLVAVIGVIAVTCFQLAVVPYREFSPLSGPAIGVAAQRGLMFGWCALLAGWLATLYLQNETDVAFIDPTPHQ